MMRFAFSLFASLASHALAHSHISPHRHLVVDDLSMVVLMADADMTQGPFYQEDSDYVTDIDLTAAGSAGSPGVEDDRVTVLGGIPLTFTLTVYDVSDEVTGVEFEDVEVYIWSCDTAGVYSSVEPGFAQPVDGVAEQIWLRGVAVTGADGKVTFQTIMPGWYGSRAIHYHVRLRFPGQEDFAATLQIFIKDSDLASYENVPVYKDNNPGNITWLDSDVLYSALDPVVADELTLDLNGTVETGFTASMNLGLVPGAVSDYQAWQWPPCLLDENGELLPLLVEGEEFKLPEACGDAIEMGSDEAGPDGADPEESGLEGSVPEEPVPMDEGSDEDTAEPTNEEDSITEDESSSSSKGMAALLVVGTLLVLQQR